MAEGIGEANPFSSGGHRWDWAPRVYVDKTVTTPGVAGAATMHLLDGPRPGRIAGRLKASAASRALADTALDVLVAAIETLCRATVVSAWEDDQAHTGSSLKVMRFVPVGRRVYPRVGATYHAWQEYVVEVLELDGAPYNS